MGLLSTNTFQKGSDYMRRLAAFVVSLTTAALVVGAVGRFIEHLPNVNAAMDRLPLCYIAAALFIVGLGVAVERLSNRALKRQFGKAFVCCAAVIVVSALAYVVMGPTIPAPEDSVQEARSAYMNRDLATFKNYVDVNAILSDGVDQLVVSPLARNAAQSGNSFDGLVSAGVAITAAAGKQAYLPELSQQIEQFVVTGSVPDQSQDNAFGIAVGSELLRMLTVSQLTYEGIDSTKQVSDSLALVTVRVRSSASPRTQQAAAANNKYPSLRIVDSQGREIHAEDMPTLITLKLRSEGSHWQIVGIENLSDLAKQLLG